MQWFRIFADGTEMDSVYAQTWQDALLSAQWQYVDKGGKITQIV